MDHKLPDKKKLSLQTLLAKIEDVLQHGSKDDPPAYTLILGAGASFGIVPTAKEMLGIPDPSTKKVHDKSIPLWLAKQREPTLDLAADADGRIARVVDFWQRFSKANRGDGRCAKIQFDASGLPLSTSVAEAYQAVFDTACVGGLDTPERHRNYMRDVTMTGGAETHLNATHFYLASLLSLQRRSGVLGSSKKPLYTGRRELARTLFTTNFDPLLQTSLQLFQLLYYMTDRPELLPPDALQTDHNPAIHLFYAHGSVHRPYMANTEDQIALLKQQNARDLAAYLGSHGVIVLGYNGWDDCLLEALNQCKTFANNLYWLVRRGSPLSEPVHKFLASHANAYCIEIEDGGVFMADLHSRLCPGAPNTELLYNPIQPLRRQLQCVNLSGIRSGSQSDRTDSGEGDERTDLPRDVDSIRKAVLAHLQDAERLFIDESPPRSEVDQKLAQADISYANKDWAAALALYGELLESGAALPVETKARALLRHGVCSRETGNSDREFADYSAVINLAGAPTELVVKARLNRSVCFERQGDHDNVLAEISAVMGLPGATAEQLAWAHFRRGDYLSNKGEFDSAIADYSAVMGLPGATAEQLAWAHFRRGDFLSKKGDIDSAIVDYSAVIDSPGSNVELSTVARFNRGVCMGKKGEIDKAIANYSAVIDQPGVITEDLAMALVNRGICYAKKQDFDKAIADLDSVLVLPDATVEHVARARLNRGVAFSQNGDHDKALADFDAVIELPGAPADIVEEARKQRMQSERRIGHQTTAESISMKRRGG
jgi:tetratricopeptide (TPR) repeat protein